MTAERPDADAGSRATDAEVRTSVEDPVALDVLLLPAFGSDDAVLDVDGTADEVGRWLDGGGFDHTVSVRGANAPVRHTGDGVGITPTGMGKVPAAATVAALLASPALDCSETVFVTVGVAGVAPDAGTLGSVFLADAVVDWDRKHRWDPSRSSAGTLPIDPLRYRPHDYVLDLDDGLVDRATAAAREVDLADPDDAALSAYRERYPHAAARGPPTVERGVTLCGDEFWHGEDLAGQAAWLCEQYGVDAHATTEMEDYGTAAALDRVGALDRYLSIRGAVNFDRPAPGESARESLDEGGPGFAFDLAMQNVVRVGSRVVEAIRDNR